MLLNRFRLSVILLLLMYGMVLIGTILDKDLMHLTAILFVASAFILFINHLQPERRLIAYGLITYISAMIIEYAGVETGKIFGQHFYGKNLGVTIADIPIVMGIIWLVLSYCSSVIAHRLCSFSSALNGWFVKVLVASILMVIVDMCFEPVAPFNDFHYWRNQTVPLQHYTAWFAFSFSFNYLFHRLNLSTDNKIAPWLYAIILLFFGILNFTTSV